VREDNLLIVHDEEKEPKAIKTYVILKQKTWRKGRLVMAFLC